MDSIRSTTPSSNAWSFPDRKETIVLNETEENLKTVAFYPYGRPGAPPVVAVAGTDVVFVLCDRGDGFEIVSIFKDEELEALPINVKSGAAWIPVKVEIRCMTWAQISGLPPLLCIAGSTRIIKVVSPKTGKRALSLTAHGKGINDLKTHPIYPNIIASASDDYTIVIWDLNAPDEANHFVALVAAFGHIDRVLCLEWHPSGDWLLSGGFDNRINLWRTPHLPHPSNEKPIRLPQKVQQPHFSSSCLHSAPVTRLAFHNNLIFSYAHGKESVLLWSIAGLEPSSRACLDAPPRICHPNQLAGTRSAFKKAPKWMALKDAHTVLINRLASFKVPGVWDPDHHNLREPFIDFGLGMRRKKPVLAVCHGTKLAFWDLDRCYAWMRLVRQGADIKVLPWVQDEPREEVNGDITMNGTDSSKANKANRTPSSSVLIPSPPKFSMPPPSTPANRNGFKNIITSKEEADRLFRSGSTATTPFRTPRTPANMMASSPSDAYSSRSSASPLTTAQKAALPLFLSSTAEGAKLLRDIAEEAADEALDGLPMDESRRRKNKPGAALYDACDPVRTLRAHEVVEGLGEDEVPRRLTWSADGKICITVGDFGVVGVYGL